MASPKKRKKYDMNTVRSTAYDGSAARVLEGQPLPHRRPKTSPRTRTRPKLRVREPGQVSLFAVTGFAAVIILAVLILMSLVNLTKLSTEISALENEMDKLQSEEADLQSRYERSYDLSAIEKAVTADGSMSRPQSGQIIYVDLTEPDNVVVYGEDGDRAGGFLDAVAEIVQNILAYF